MPRLGRWERGAGAWMRLEWEGEEEERVIEGKSIGDWGQRALADGMERVVHVRYGGSVKESSNGGSKFEGMSVKTIGEGQFHISKC
uniref:Uncharacterized protein n=1 Tax=Oryza punctata TaxID=4537 RepID=A0A0E0MM62_ORYPU